MEYINNEMLTQQQVCNVEFTFHSEKVNSYRYKSTPYDTLRGQVRQFDVYLPKEIFIDKTVPESLTMRILVDLE